MLKNILYSVFWNKCPQCHKGDVFVSKQVFNLKKFDKLHETCNHCGHKYEKEPGFFYGAMYVSYALMVAWFVTTWGINTFFVKANPIYYLIFLTVSIVLLMTYTFRLSRLLWINFFTQFGEYNKKTNQKSKNSF